MARIRKVEIYVIPNGILREKCRNFTRRYMENNFINEKPKHTRLSSGSV